MSTAERPLVSIIVPSYNQGRFIQETLDSIFMQDYRPLEVIVVDGASTDETVPVLERAAAAHPELRWVSEPDDGPEEAFNKGLAMAQGEVAAFQSSDDIYYPGAVSAAVAGFAAHPHAGIIYANAMVIDAESKVIGGPTPYLPWTLKRYLCGSTFIPQSSAFFRTALAREVGGVRKRYFVFDVDLWLRMMFRAEPVRIDGVLSAYRYHEVQRDKQVAEILSSFRRMLSESPEIRNSPWRVRLAAWAGGRMLTQFYNPTGYARYATYQMWLAILAYPPSVRAVMVPKRLIPAPPTMRGLIRRLRKAFLLPAR